MKRRKQDESGAARPATRPLQLRWDWVKSTFLEEEDGDEAIDRDQAS